MDPDYYIAELPSETSSDESIKPEAKKNEYRCTHEGCSARFSKPSKLAYHIRRHTGERPFVCDEPNCDKTYLYSFHLRRHKETHHSTHVAERVCCPVEGCYMEISNKYNLKKHIKRKHHPERSYPFTCDECKQGFFKKRQLLQHSYIHTGIFPFRCDICDLGLPTLRACNRHKRTHTNYKCKCGKNFERWTLLLVHRKMCNEAGLRCNVCDRTFLQRSNLKVHLQLHLEENSKKNFICAYDNCGRSYLYKKNLVYHINTFHKKIPLPRIACTESGCTRTFNKRQNLKRHIELCHSKDVQVESKNGNRKPRKDIGKSKKSVAAELVGLQSCVRLQQLHHDVIQSYLVKVSSNTTVNKLINSSQCSKNNTTESSLRSERSDTIEDQTVEAQVESLVVTTNTGSEGSANNQSNSSESEQTSKETIDLLKTKIEEALLKNINENNLEGYVTGDNEIIKPCVEPLVVK